MKATQYEIARIADGLYEIGEFDCASMFLIIGGELALLIDAGVGIGDIRGALAALTDKPLTLALTHNHIDHIGFAPVFGEAYIHPLDAAGFETGGVGMDLEGRKGYVRFIAQRSGRTYAYNLDEDIDEWNPAAVSLKPLQDMQTFDLGGRVVTAYHCPGHTPGSCVFLDEQSRILLLGDALNCNLLYGISPNGQGVSVEKALGYLERLQAMRDKYDCYYNGHYDFRAFGEPLGADVLPDAITACKALVSGNYTPEEAPSMFPGGPPRTVITVGRTMITYSADGIREKR